jgi:putative mRNA 3-end processing factor
MRFMIEITFLGGCQEVGRMGIVIDNGTQRFLLEYGVNVEHMDVPIHPEMPIHAIFLSHAHLDHSGHIPSLYRQGWNGRVYATPGTFEITNMLLKDSLKVQKIKGLQPKYSYGDIASMDHRGVDAHFRRIKHLKTADVTFNDAGHVPGSSSILIETEGKRILFTGDIKFEETLLMNEAFTDFQNIDILITEATYSYKNHPHREQTANKIRELVTRTLQGGGFAILPCFAVGRTQEMLLMVSDLGYPVYVDGMGIGATRYALMHPESVKDHGKLKEAFSRARKVRGHKHRKEAIKSPSIIITTAGMLNGGPVHFYLKKLMNDERSIMIISGFQVPGTVGRTLLDTGRYVYEGVDAKPKLKIEFLDLSAHCGRDGIINFIKKVKPKKTFLVHGERTVEFSKELNRMGFHTTAPKTGDKVRI